MSMHLHHPSLSTTGKKKGKSKFRNASQAAKSRELNDSWKDLNDRYPPLVANIPKKKKLNTDTGTYKPGPSIPEGRNTTAHIKSRGDGVGNAAMPPPKVYTGSSMLGIGQLHKSNAVPVFSQDDAIAISRMRR